jgi:hypothetical protein
MPLKSQDKERIAIDEVNRGQVNRQPSNVRVKQQESVFDGTLIVVSWHSDKDNKDTESLVFFRDDKPRLFFTPLEMARFLNDSQSKHTSVSFMREVFTVGGAPAVIALLVTLTICYLATVKDSADLQKALVHALSLILGFYFGTKVPKSAGLRSANKG